MIECKTIVQIDINVLIIEIHKLVFVDNDTNTLFENKCSYLLFVITTT